MSLLHHPALEALCAAAYLEDYIDCMEILPNNVQRYISEIRELDCQYLDYLKEANRQKNIHMRAKDLVAQTRAMKSIQQALVRCTEIGDEKLKLATQISELIEIESRQLKHDLDNLDPQQSYEDELKKINLEVSNGTFCGSFSSKNSSSSTNGSTRSSRQSNPPLRHLNNDSLSFRTPKRVDTPNRDKSLRNSNGSCSINIGSGRDNRSGSKRKTESEDIHISSSSKKYDSDSSSSRKRDRNRRDSRSNADSDDDIPLTKRKNLLSKKSNPDEKKTEKNKKQSSTSSRTRKNTTYDTPVDPDEDTYCFCDEVSYGQMVCCDNSKCSIEWFHFRCVDLTSKPKGKWYCPSCRGDRSNVLKTMAR